MMAVLGLGHDVVDMIAFAEQLAEPGSRMRQLFSARELRQASARAQSKHDGEAVHLAAKWAGKEAVLKAWDVALADRPAPYTLDNFPWAGIEILDDSRGRPRVMLMPQVEANLRRSLSGDLVDGAAVNATAAVDSSENYRWHISLSHDGPIASAVVLIIDSSGLACLSPTVTASW